jgi:plastocyanin
MRLLDYPAPETEETMMKKTIGLMALTALAMAVGCGDSGTGGAGGGSSGGSPAAGGGEEGGAGPTMLNGCDLASADDQTDVDMVDIAWKLSTQECIRVAAGTTVNWNLTAPDTFTTHPLKGGSPGSPEAGLISDSDQTGDSASVTFAAAGEFPFFCNIHQSSMQGVIYVE